MTISIQAICDAIGAAPAGAPYDPAHGIDGWSIDSRTINPGDCFFALRGPTHDGHAFVPALAENQAALAIVDHVVEGAAVPQFVVPDTLVALQQLARWSRAHWGGTVVGVTGSAGKTTTKDAIAALLSVGIRTGRTIGNYNNPFGVPLSLLRLPDDCRAAVIEMGMNHAGEIRQLCDIAKPDIGVITNVGWAHAENFPDGISGIALAKRELIESLPPAGTAILNADDPRVREFRHIHPGRSLLFGFAADADVRAEDLQLSPDGARFVCRSLAHEAIAFRSPLAGRHGVSNVLAAIAAAEAMHIAPARLVDAVHNLSVGKMRGERFEKNGITVINDCYNSNPEAVRSMIELLRGTPASRRIVVLGEMLELGREAEPLHRGLGQFAAEQGIHAVIGIRGAARFMVDQAGEAGLSDSAASFFESPEEAGDFLRDYLRPGDAVLFKGSRGVQVEKAIERALGN